MAKKLPSARASHHPAIPRLGMPLNRFQGTPGEWGKHLATLAKQSGVPESVLRGFRGAHAKLQYELTALAAQVDDWKTFLALVKEAWAHAQYKKSWSAGNSRSVVRGRGRPSVKDQCFAAIKAGHDALGLPDAEFWMDGEDLVVYRNNNYQPLTIGRLAGMILERVPNATPSVARKYARLWDRNGGGSPDPDQRRTLGMKLSRETKKIVPGLYKKKPQGASSR